MTILLRPLIHGLIHIHVHVHVHVLFVFLFFHLPSTTLSFQLQPPPLVHHNTHSFYSKSAFVAFTSTATTTLEDNNQWRSINPQSATTTTTRSRSLQRLYSSTTDYENPSETILQLQQQRVAVEKSLDGLANGSDIRGRFVDHPKCRLLPVGDVVPTGGSSGEEVGAGDDDNCDFASVLQAMASTESKAIAPLTPFSAHCLGYAFATMVNERMRNNNMHNRNNKKKKNNKTIRICIGRDPRSHGVRLADAFARGCLQLQDDEDDNNNNNDDDDDDDDDDTSNTMIEVLYTGVATTPSMMDFCRTGLCDAAVILTASHLPGDRNGMKFFVAGEGGFTKSDIQELLALAKKHANFWITNGSIPPSSKEGDVYCSQHVDYMPLYAASLAEAIQKETCSSSADHPPLEGLQIVLNSGCGSGSFFYHVLKSLGADVSASIGIEHDSTFPLGVPNPESKTMVQDTIRKCQETNADLGIMLDTDADRSGFIVPGSNGSYEPLNRNRLIALLGVIFSTASPGCTFVTDSVTSEGLQDFLQQHLGLIHVRYLKGYANVIAKAKEITKSGAAIAEVAIETSGHCAMRENDYLDDGTYTAVKVLGLLAKVKRDENDGENENENKNKNKNLLLNLIANLKELPETPEFRLSVLDETLETTNSIFEIVTSRIETYCKTHHSWKVDEENLEGLRVRTDNNNNNNDSDSTRNTVGGFFMFRKSLHDPIVSVQVEGESTDQVREHVIQPLYQLLQGDERVVKNLDLSVLSRY